MRTCEYKNCTYPVFGTDKNTNIGYCRSHQGHRTDKKAKKPAFRSSKPKKTFDFGFESQIDLFAWLWNDAKNEKGEIFCKYTGEKLNKYYNTDQSLSCFAHLLPKGKYTYFRLNPKNIRVVSPIFHRVIDQGTYLDRINHPSWNFSLWDQEVEEMKVQYQLFKKQNLLA